MGSIGRAGKQGKIFSVNGPHPNPLPEGEGIIYPEGDGTIRPEGEGYTPEGYIVILPEGERTNLQSPVA